MRLAPDFFSTQKSRTYDNIENIYISNYRLKELKRMFTAHNNHSKWRETDNSWQKWHFITLQKEQQKWTTILAQTLTPLRCHHSIMLVTGGTGLDTALSPGPWAIWLAVAWAIGTLLGVPGADAGEPAFEPINDTGVLQPEGGWEPIAGTEPGFIDAGAGDAEADGGLEPTCWLLPATWEYQKKNIKIKFENSKNWNDKF